VHDHPPETAVAHAVDSLRRGNLVAFPTETVYGLGADALNPDAVARVFLAKGRPAINPLIVHVASVDMARSLASHWPAPADALARAFWPGPLTIVVPKSARIPDVVTAGGPTVALRQPNHPIAADLLHAFGGPLVGPSANRSGHVSPTTAAHVRDEFDGTIPVLDGGPCALGIESTVVLIADDALTILRPGALGAADLARATGLPVTIRTTHAQPGQASVHTATPTLPASALPSPGLLASHYAPAALVQIVDDPAQAPRDAFPVSLPRDAAAAARVLYTMLREADTRCHALGLSTIAVVIPDGARTDADPRWAAVLDRLDRAAAPRPV
jgi:L-threonylcarbamoyladenylate synthase